MKQNMQILPQQEEAQQRQRSRLAEQEQVAAWQGPEAETIGHHHGQEKLTARRQKTQARERHRV